MWKGVWCSVAQVCKQMFYMTIQILLQIRDNILVWSCFESKLMCMYHSTCWFCSFAALLVCILEWYYARQMYTQCARIEALPSLHSGNLSTMTPAMPGRKETSVCLPGNEEMWPRRVCNPSGRIFTCKVCKWTRLRISKTNTLNDTCTLAWPTQYVVSDLDSECLNRPPHMLQWLQSHHG